MLRRAAPRRNQVTRAPEAARDTTAMRAKETCGSAAGRARIWIDAESGPMEAKICYFIAICRYRSFKAAAQACGVSTPSVSMGVQRLERALGRRLFERRRPVRLTPLAHELWPMLEELHGLADRIDRVLEPPTGAAGGTAAGDGDRDAGC